MLLRDFRMARWASVGLGGYPGAVAIFCHFPAKMWNSPKRTPWGNTGPVRTYWLEEPAGLLSPVTRTLLDQLGHSLNAVNAFAKAQARTPWAKGTEERLGPVFTY